MDLALELAVRAEAMRHLKSRLEHDAIYFTRNEQFEYHGDRLRLMGTQTGIWKPRQLSAALSISTTFTPPSRERPYDDADIGPDGLGRYKWRGTDPEQANNRALRAAMTHKLPLIWFRAFDRGRYVAIYPVYLVREEAEQHQFVVAVDAVQQLDSIDMTYPGIDIQLAYASRETRQRLHQAPFRAAVLDAYTCKCAVCRFGHASLLDAAHITPDAEDGLPTVANGLSLCKMHHGAYDSGLIGITPDLTIEINHDVLNEIDGPMLRHGIQEFHGRSLMVLPKHKAQRPDRDALDLRYQQFLSSSSTR